MCSVCKEAGDESKLVICEMQGVEGIRNCQLAIHTYCLKPKLRKVPDGDFYCPRCKSLSSSQQLCATLRSRILALSTSRSAIEQERRAAIERKRIAADRKAAARQQYLLMQSTRSSRRRKQVDYTGAAFDKMISESIRNAEGKEKKSRSSRSRRQESDDGDWARLWGRRGDCRSRKAAVVESRTRSSQASRERTVVNQCKQHIYIDHFIAFHIIISIYFKVHMVPLAPYLLYKEYI